MNKLRGTGLILAGIAIGACARSAVPVLTARAGGAHRCEYTQIQDSSKPNIGTNGIIAYDEDWAVVLSAGFNLREVVGEWYIFERCQ